MKFMLSSATYGSVWVNFGAVKNSALLSTERTWFKVQIRGGNSYVMLTVYPVWAGSILNRRERRGALTHHILYFIWMDDSVCALETQGLRHSRVTLQENPHCVTASIWQYQSSPLSCICKRCHNDKLAPRATGGLWSEKKGFCSSTSFS